MNSTAPDIGIVFDLDGTLWDTSDRIIPVWNEVLSRHGQRRITKADMSGYMGKTPDAISRLMLPELPHDCAMSVLKECFYEEEIYLSRNGGVLYSGVEATLSELKKMFGLYIVSNCDSGYLDSFFAAHGLKKYFDDFETYGNTGLSKAENIGLVVRRNNLSGAVYVGDTELDRISAETAGVPFIFAAYGFGTADGAEYRIEKISDLPHCLNCMNQVYHMDSITYD